MSNDFGSCRTCGKPALLNGYCQKHQFHAIEGLIQNMNELNRRWKSIERNAEPEAVENLKSQLQRTRQTLVQAKEACLTDPDCQVELDVRKLLVAMDDVMQGSELPEKLTQSLQDVQARIFTTALPTETGAAKAQSLLVDQDIQTNRAAKTDQKIQQVEEQLNELLQTAERSQNDTNTALGQLRDEYDAVAQARKEAQSQLNLVEQRLDQFRAETSQATGTFTVALQKTMEERDKFKALYDEANARELVLAKKIQLLQENSAEVAKELSKMKARYENQLKNMRDQFAEHIVSGGQILSQREMEMQRQVELLEGSLQESKRLFEDSKRVNQKLLEKDTHGARLARQMLDTNHQLAMAQKELAQMKSKENELRTMVAENELRCEQQTYESVGQLREDNNKLNDQIIRLQQEISEKQRHAAQMQNRMYDLQRQQKLEISTLETELQRVRSELHAARISKQQAEEQLRNADALTKQKIQHSDMQLKLQYDRLKDTLTQQLRDKERELGLQRDRLQAQLLEEKRALDINKNSLNEAANEYKKRKETLAKERLAFDTMQQQFLKDRAEIETARIRAEMQAKQFEAVENDYKERLRVMEQQIEIQQKRSSDKIKELQAELAQLRQQRSEITQSLERCSVAKEDLIQRSATMTEENLKLKDEAARAKFKMDQMQREYDITLNKLRVDGARMQSDIQVCSSSLSNVSLAHAHMKRLKDEADERFRILQEQYREAKEKEAFARTLMRDKEMAKNEYVKLQAVTKDMEVAKRLLQQQLDSATAELKQSKAMEARLSTELQRLSDQLSALFAKQQSEMEKERSQMLASVQEEKAKATLYEQKFREAANRAAVAERQRLEAQNLLAKNQSDRARELELLVASQQMSTPGSYAKGASSLLSV